VSTAYDYSGGAIAPAALHAAGVTTVMRYVSTPGNSKNITRQEYAELVAAGITVGLVYETTAQWMLGGYSAGLAAAKSARAQATAVGYPTTRRIWYADDFQDLASQLDTAVDCLHGAADAEGSKGLVAVYGDFDVCNAAVAAGFEEPWQTDAWSSGRWCGAAVLRQTGQQATCGGIQVDVNELVGALFPGPVKPTPTPIVQLEEEDTMLIIDAPRSAEANAARDMWLLGNGKYMHIPDAPSYQAINNAGPKVAVVQWATHQALLAEYGATPVGA
jgi:hypothetical protein